MVNFEIDVIFIDFFNGLDLGFFCFDIRNFIVLGLVDFVEVILLLVDVVVYKFVDLLREGFMFLLDFVE